MYRRAKLNILIVKPTRCSCFKNLFILINTLHVSDGLSVYHQEFMTVHTATGICQTDTAATLLLAGKRDPSLSSSSGKARSASNRQSHVTSSKTMRIF